uniref:Uncharacterized protein n=1 Tax=viral metagenome TaxID=1070528 RepID=A0A6C0CSA4_9ZZZZ
MTGIQSLSKSTRIMSNRSMMRTYCISPKSHTPHNTVQNYVVPLDITLAIKDAEDSVKHSDMKLTAVKWDIVDELWTQYIHQENRKNIYEKIDTLEAYCNIEIDALECRDYDV